MSVDPGDYDEGAPDPEGGLLDPDDESTLDETDRFDPVDEGDFTNDPGESLYDASWVPPDRQPKQTDYGTTLSEMRDGEALDRRLVEEEPDVFERELGDPLEQTDESYDARIAAEADGEDPEVEEELRADGGDTDFPTPEFEPEDPRAGRLVAPDEGAHRDEEKDLVAFDEGVAGAGSSAEEAAVHVVDEP